MSCSQTTSCTCGCCAGTAVRTPQGELNPPAQPAIAYRTGTWNTFKQSMLARLSSSDFPALAGLKSRSDDDFSIALLDASSVVMDILTFYQERLANESYLRTATRYYSVTQIGALIGYRPLPGVAASVHVAFALTSAPGQPPNLLNSAISIPAGTTIQSVPAQGQKPQTFQTSTDILGKSQWNALAVQTGNPWTPNKGDTSIYLDGVSTQLQPGDAFLIVGDERRQDKFSTNWDLRLVSSVQPDPVKQRTLVTWLEPLGFVGEPSSQSPRFYALRQRASLYGYNAASPLLLASDTQKSLKDVGLIGPSALGNTDWLFGYDSVNAAHYSDEQIVDLDAVYGRITPNGWLVLIVPDQNTIRTPAGYAHLYGIQSVTTTTRSDYGISAKVTRIATDTYDSLNNYSLLTRVTSALAQSEQLTPAEQPLNYPLYGTIIDLDGVRDDLSSIKAIALNGKSQKLTLNAGMELTFTPFDGTDKVTLNAGDVLTVLDPPPTDFNADGTVPSWSDYTTAVEFTVADPNGRPGTVNVPLSAFGLAASDNSDAIVQEFALVSSVTLISPPKALAPRTRIVLKNPLMHCYERATTTLNANVGAATAGSPVTELLGSGSAATPNQAFTLKQSPLTYVSAATPAGTATSLSISANGATWAEVPSLYNQQPAAQAYDVTNLTGGSAAVQFGDGVEGATLPTGQYNIVATYRVGIGAATNVAAGSITTLVDRPLGVSGVTNPSAATGGQDAESIDDIRTNASKSMLTLGRAVSITDYENFAASFPGIAKAHALWIQSGLSRGVFLTLAAVGGVQLKADDATLLNLVAALRSYGNPHVNVFAQSFCETLFSFNADIAYDPRCDSSVVQISIRSLVNTTYSFTSRSFSQGISADEIAARIQGVTGVVAVNVTKLKIGLSSKAGDLGSAGYSVATYNAWIQQKITLERPTSCEMRICPYVPVTKLSGLPSPADLLVIDPNPASVVLGVMA
jgi:hypothetical protein